MSGSERAACDLLYTRELGVLEYSAALALMQEFTATRTPETADEIWLLEHPPVYTAGVRARKRPTPVSSSIPFVTTDRGGDLTYHGPGQAIVYVLFDLARRGLSAHALVRALEQAVIELLADVNVAGMRRPKAPGVYVSDRKIAALGLRIRRGASYHGLALNVHMNLEPFRAIDPCGYPGLEITQLADVCDLTNAQATGRTLIQHLRRELRYTDDVVAHPGLNLCRRKPAELHDRF